MTGAAPEGPGAASFSRPLDADDGRLLAPSAVRNGPPLVAALARWFAGRTGPVLEIGSGTGQHAAAFRLAFPDLHWIASDPAPENRASIRAWARFSGLPETEPLDLDAAGDWPARPEIEAHGPLTAVVSMNVIHISPFAVAQGIVRGAGRALGPGGLLVFYGPFRENGRHTGDGNARFDAGLRARDPAWGIRDTAEIGALADAAGLSFAAFEVMPANNRLLVFRALR